MSRAGDDVLDDLPDYGVPDQFDGVDQEENPFQVPPADGGVPEAGEQDGIPVADGGLFPGLPSCCEGAITEDLGFTPVDPETVTVDPTAETIIGHPEVADEYWMYQGEGNGTCAPTSVAMMLSDVLGVPVPSDAVIERALELGIMQYDPSAEGLAQWSGMNNAGIMTLAESFGLDVNLRYGDIEDIAAYLAAGHSVTVGLDAHEIWYGEDDDANADDQGVNANHQVVVTGIDLENGLVYLNDSGLDSGGTSVIPLDQFADAWADDANSIIVTDLSIDEAAANIDVADLVGEGDGLPVIDRIVPADANWFIEPLAEVGAEAGAAVPQIDLDRIEIEPPDSALEGVAQLLILPFTFVARFADRVL